LSPDYVSQNKMHPFNYSTSPRILVGNWELPLPEGAHPESDTSDLLTAEMATLYRAIIVSLNRAFILGRFDIMYATNTLARVAMAPRLGHLEAAK
jgi:hypothetical protein